MFYNKNKFPFICIKFLLLDTDSEETGVKKGHSRELIATGKKLQYHVTGKCENKKFKSEGGHNLIDTHISKNEALSERSKRILFRKRSFVTELTGQLSICILYWHVFIKTQYINLHLCYMCKY